MQPRKDDGKPAQKKAIQSKMVAPAPKMATAAPAKMASTAPAKMATPAPAKMMAAKMATSAPAKMMAAKMATSAPAKMMAAKMATSAPATHGPSSYAPIEVTPPPPYGSFSSLTNERYATGDRTSVNIDNSQRNVSNVMNGSGGGGGEQGDMLNAVLLALLVKKREAAATGPEIAPGLAMFNAPVTADNFPSIQKDIADAQALLSTPSPIPAPMFDLPQATPGPAASGWGAKRVVALALVAASVAASGRFVATGRERLSLFFAALALASAIVL